MRLLVLALLALASLDHPEVEGGIGFVIVTGFDQTLAFYESPTDAAPAASVALSDEGEIPSPAWLRPETWGVDYYQLRFRAREIREDGWARVVVHEEAGREVWLQTDPNALPFVPWETFLVEHLTVAERLDPLANPLRTAPSFEAPLAPDADPFVTEDWATDCLLPVEIRGEWARVVPSSLCARGVSSDPPTLGWIRWRDGDRLLVSYHSTC